MAKGNKPKASKLDPYKTLIDKWLVGDCNKKRKQQHTATRIFNRLKEEIEGFNRGNRTVTRYVAEKKKQLVQDNQSGFLLLLHNPGEAQADFGTADFYEVETLYRDAKYLVLSFNHSNGAYLQLNYGENLECLLEGLVAMFEHIGGVPNEKWLTDITEFNIPAGKVYLSPIIDCFDGMPITWTIGTSPCAELVNTMLDDGIAHLKPAEYPIVHTDRGCHYRWPRWIQRMDEAGLTRSMPKKGCSPDNAACEGFFGRLKNGMFYAIS